MQEGNDYKLVPFHHVHYNVRRIEYQKLIGALYPAGMTYAGFRRKQIESLHNANYDVPGRQAVIREDVLVAVFQIFRG